MFDIPNLKTERVYSIQELNNTVRDLIRDEFPQYVWVCGEIQDLHERLHVNLNLVQKDPESNDLLAQVSCVIFSNIKSHIYKRIEESGSGFELKKDIEVKFLCKVDLYAKNGKFSLTVFDIDPIYTLGKVALNRQKIIEELKKEGLVDKNKARVIPQIPLKIGLITALGSAAYHDFINELNISTFGFTVSVCDSHMQGKNVEKDLIRALKFFNNLKKDKLDLIVITRGGGSTADLGWFDNKKIAISIAKSNFAVVTALGHHINTTIADLVSNTSLKTPTKAAQFIVDMIKAEVEKISQLSKSIFEQAQDFIQNDLQSLETKTLYADSFVGKYFQDIREDLANKKTLIKSISYHYIQIQKDKTLQSSKLINVSLKNIFVDVSSKIKNIQEKIKILDPKTILKRGYSISIKGSKAIKSISDLSKGDTIRTLFSKGEAVSIVKDLKEK